VALKHKPSKRYAMNFSPETRASLMKLVKLSSTCNTMAAVISSVVARYLRILERQLEVEGRGRVLRVYEEGAGQPPLALFELDLRL